MTEDTGPGPLDEARSRLDALTREVDALEGDVRAAAERLRAGIARLRGSLEDLENAPTAVAGHAPGADVDGARLTALDLVLRETPRAEAESMLSEKFPGIDAGLLLDDVAQASAG
jgi:hypothetical protein